MIVIHKEWLMIDIRGVVRNTWNVLEMWHVIVTVKFQEAHVKQNYIFLDALQIIAKEGIKWKTRNETLNVIMQDGN